jgi:acyl-CoA thioester hydrolase
MGVVYHAHYLVWCDMARTEHLRRVGFNYRALEESGTRLAVTEVGLRYRQPARFDDEVVVRCWVREVTSRVVRFGYAIERLDAATLLATAHTTLVALNRHHTPTRLAPEVRRALLPVADPVRV